MNQSQETLLTSIEKPRFTGKTLVMLNPESTQRKIFSQAKNASLRLAAFGEYASPEADFNKAFDEGDGIVFEKLGIAVINEHREREVNMLTESDTTGSAFLYSEPERYIYALNGPFDDFLTGYKSAVDDLYNRLVKKEGTDKPVLFQQQSDKNNSWGINATNLHTSKYTGKGVKIAILDTGLKTDHPDFAGRTIETYSFITGETVDDKNGHGTHCTGIASGDNNKGTGYRYGVAKEAMIYFGKVLSNRGVGTDTSILAGLDWALSNGCNIVSMSLGAALNPGESYSRAYDDVAKKALKQGTLIIAAAGNESKRHLGQIAPVGHPANCPSIMAVAALDSTLSVASFSCGGINGDGGQIDIAAPGVEVYSSWIAPEMYKSISGTSMATPFVAGIAGLYWEANPAATASDIWMFLTQNAKRLTLSASDVGAGLVQAPQ
jgi:subtilisin